jgi:hypothetical protein
MRKIARQIPRTSIDKSKIDLAGVAAGANMFVGESARATATNSGKADSAPIQSRAIRKRLLLQFAFGIRAKEYKAV